MTIEVKYHWIEQAEGHVEQIKVFAVDRPTHGNAHHEYQIEYEGYNVGEMSNIFFQDGPVKEYGVNGITNEALLSIVAHRLECFQAGDFACDANEHALINVLSAIYHLQKRTIDRVKRGVEGKNEK